MPRWIVVVLLAWGARSVPSTAHAEPALASAEVRLSYGLATGGGAGRASVRGAPLVLAAGGAIALRDQPRVNGYASLVVESLDRTGAGGEAGFQLAPSARLRLRSGAIAIVRPYTLWGAAVAGAACGPFAGVRACGELAANVFVGGTDLPERRAVVQVLLGIGVVIDVL